MPILQDIFRKHGPAYMKKYGQAIPGHHKKALMAIMSCRSKALGGQLYYCPQCREFHYSYHSCQNRHCVVCQNNDALDWTQKQKGRLLPFTYFLATFTLPEQLRKLARSHQKLFYNILFKASSEALKLLAKDPKYLGAHIGMVAVLHTWTRALFYHPHVHYLIPGGGIVTEGNNVRFAKDDFLMHVKALSVIFRAKFRDALKKNDDILFGKINKKVWKTAWVVHIKTVGNGKKALEYMGRYLFRVAISNNRILKTDKDKVTFRYTDSKTGRMITVTLGVFEFMRRFLQHVLPHQFIKVRYYGFLAPAARKSFNRLRKMLFMTAIADKKNEQQNNKDPRPLLLCPVCGKPLQWVAEIPKGFYENAP